MCHTWCTSVILTQYLGVCCFSERDVYAVLNMDGILGLTILKSKEGHIMCLYLFCGKSSVVVNYIPWVSITGLYYDGG